jgi:hypothetical protein
MRTVLPSLQVTVVAALLLLGRGTVHAEDAVDSRSLLEEPRSRQGYWVGLGLSEVSAQLHEDGKNRGIYSGSTVTFRIGQLLTPRLGLGLLVEYIGGVQKGSDKGSVGGLTLEGSCRLWRDLSVHTGFGIGFVMVKDDKALDPSLRGGGGSYFLLGTSYDFFPFKKRLTGGWALTPVVDLHVMPDGSIKYVSVMAGMQLTWWSGLPSNMIHLPDE